MLKRKIRIGYLLTKLELGGAQKHLLSLIEHLDPEKFETLLMTSAEEGPLTPYAKELLGDRFIEIPSLRREIRPTLDLRAKIEILSALKKYPVDIVHTHSSKAGILGRWSAHQTGIKQIVHTVHGFGFHSEQPWWEKHLYISVEQRAALITSRLIAVSKAVIEEGCCLNIGMRSQYEWIPNGIDSQPFSEVSSEIVLKVKEELGIPRESPLVTMIACFKPQKAPLDFVKAAVIVARRFPQTRFLMIGDGVLRSQIEKERSENQMDQRIILAGWRGDIPAVLAGSNLVVLTSRWEGLPLTLLEAMASGKAIVATRVGGIPEVVKEGENGFLITAGDVEGLARCMIHLLENVSLAEKMGREGKRLFDTTADYQIESMVSRLESLYQELSCEVICQT